MDLKTQWDVLATWIRAHVKEERGASLVEYALLVALIAVVCIAAVSLLGSSASTKFSTIGSAGIVRDLNLTNVSVSARATDAYEAR